MPGNYPLFREITAAAIFYLAGRTGLCYIELTMRTAVSILLSSVLVISSTTVSSMFTSAPSDDVAPASCCCKVKSSCGCGCEHQKPAKSGGKLPVRLFCGCDAPAVPTVPSSSATTTRSIEELATPLVVAIALDSAGDRVLSHYDKFAGPPDSAAPISSIILLI